jgi:hypothetical protein
VDKLTASGMSARALRNLPLAITHAPDGHVAEWLRSRLQIRLFPLIYQRQF